MCYSPCKTRNHNNIFGIPVKELVDYLGIKICKDQKERNNLNFTQIIRKIKQKFNSWLMRDLSLEGRILLSKTEGLSRLVYTALALDVPQSIIKEVDTVLFNFIWKNRPHYLNKKQFYAIQLRMVV